MNNHSLLLGVLLCVALLVGGIAWWLNSGYGEVSGDAYEVAKALYGTCLAEDEDRLERVTVLLEEQNDEDTERLAITPKERRWLESMIDTARKGDWKSAARSARRMMEDQVTSN